MWKKQSSWHDCLVFLFFVFLLSLCTYSHADTVLTDEETQTILDEIQKSKKELQIANEELMKSKEALTSLENETQTLKVQLNEVHNTYEEQKTSYETQISEAQKKNCNLKTATTITGTSSVIFLILMIVFIII